jgi:hypothetical protein
MNTLKSINKNNNNELFNDNLKYLDNLNKSINNINDKLNNININKKTIKKIIVHLDLSNDFKFLINIDNIEYNNLLHFISQTKQNIIKLKYDIPNYDKIKEKKEICDEYYLFHNNIIKNIKKFINYYNEYFDKLNKIYSIIEPIIKNKNNELNCLIFNHNELCKNFVFDPNFSSRNKEKKHEIDNLTTYNNYVVEQINNYHLIKSETKNIDISFLNKIKKISYN